MGIIWTSALFVIVAQYVDRDTQNYVLFPLESMFEKVRILSKKPMLVMDVNFENRAGLVSIMQGDDGGKKKSTDSAIKFIDKAVIKIAHLLAIGYGEAGTKIISDIMCKEGDVDINRPGDKIMAMFGFCGIRHFGVATESLETGVMGFVNSISAVVHTNIGKYGGYTNKNIGEAYLVLWKLTTED